MGVSLELGESAMTLTYYSDAQCKTKAPPSGPPENLASNPVTIDTGKCTKLFAFPAPIPSMYVKEVSCDSGGKAKMQLYQKADCTGDNDSAEQDEGKCVKSNDTYSIVSCGAGDTGAIVGGVIGGLVVIGCIAYYYYFYVYKPQQAAEAARKAETGKAGLSNPVHA